jgi:secreted PhoX family phosphatase
VEELVSNDSSVVPYGVVDHDYEDSNRSGNSHFADVLEANMKRRALLKGSLGVAIAGLFGTTADDAFGGGFMERTEKEFLRNLAKNGIPLPLPTRPSFAAIPTSRADSVSVPAGYTARAFLPWGTPIAGSYPAYREGGLNTGEEQEQQVGQHHDGSHYFPLPDDPNNHAIFCLNHEYIEQRYLLPNGQVTDAQGRRPADDVRKEIAAHGVSVVEIRRSGGVQSEWQVVRGIYNRRITAGTPMEITGPARGHAKMVTAFSPDGTRTRGTINNCGHGFTPWGTYLTCEENWAGYFLNTDTTRPREHTRYGVPSTGSRYRWETVEPRFNAAATGASASADFRNEPNGQGWIVEIDPFNPASVPKKRTAMGRFAHEGAWFAPPRVGERIVYYMGDDSQNEYVYKFVTEGVWVPFATNPDLLDRGTLYAARFNADGTGTWLPLDIGDAAFRAAAAARNVTFTDQGDVVINTRLAADVVGATRMDRPEWGAVDPRNRAAYMTMTNNSSRQAGAVDTANPRGPNPFGHILRWREDGDRPEATSFRWEIWCLSGTETDSSILPVAGAAPRRLDASNIHASPDGLWFDQAGAMWIQTDMSGSQLNTGPFGNNQMLLADNRTGEIRRFFVGPVGQETTGVVSTPDLRTLFVGVQHPGEQGQGDSTWPGGPGTRPRSALVVVTKNDGGLIGT